MAFSSKPFLLVVASLWLALVADVLLRGASWGLNVGLVALTFAGTLTWLSSLSPSRAPYSKALGAMAVGFALLFALRDSNALKVANALALALCVGGMLLPAAGRTLWGASFGELLVKPFAQIFALPLRLFALAEKTREAGVLTSSSQKRLTAVARGLAFAAPLLLVFGGLFASADTVFRSRLESLTHPDLDFQAANGHLWTFLAAFVLTGGLLHRVFVRDERAGPPPPPPSRMGKIGATEGAIVLGSVNALFASFLVVQFGYLFGTRDSTVVAKGLTYAEYARSGFFELVCVAALALGLLLVADAVRAKDGRGAEASFRWLGRALVLMVLLVVASALKRMGLYTDAFGLTELRVYATVFMVWLTLAFAWMLATILRGRPKTFGYGSLMAGLFTIFGTNLLDPDGLIVRTNLSKPGADLSYLTTLSDDAVVALRDHRSAVAPSDRQTYDALIGRRQVAAKGSDWRELNLARWTLAR